MLDTLTESQQNVIIAFENSTRPTPEWWFMAADIFPDGDWKQRIPALQEFVRKGWIEQKPAGVGAVYRLTASARDAIIAAE